MGCLLDCVMTGVAWRRGHERRRGEEDAVLTRRGGHSYGWFPSNYRA